MGASEIMTEILAVFRSRTQALDCKARLCAMGVAATVIATPSELKIGCGFSVKYPWKAHNSAKFAIAHSYSTFNGFYAVSRGAGGSFYKKM